MRSGRTLGIAAFLLAATALAARPLAHRALFPGAGTPIPSTADLDRFVPGAERLVFASADGTRLTAARIPARGASIGTAIYFHATNQAAADALFFARDLAERGLDVCVPEHRGYGGLAGDPTVAAILEDGRAAIDACPRSSNGPRVLVGRSLGSAVAVEEARRGRADALVLVSPFTSLNEVAAPFGLALAPHDRFNLAAALREVTVPVTVVHGTADALIPFRMGHQLAAASDARLVALDGVGHNTLFLGEARTRLIDAVVDAAEELNRQPFDSLRSLRVRGGDDAS